MSLILESQSTFVMSVCHTCGSRSGRASTQRTVRSCVLCTSSIIMKKTLSRHIRANYWMFEIIFNTIYKFYGWDREQQKLKCEEIIRSVYKTNTILFSNKSSQPFYYLHDNDYFYEKNLKLSWMWLAYSIWS